MRKLNELIEDKDPAWPMIQAWLRDAASLVDVLPAQEFDRGAALVATQVTTNSTLGAIAEHPAADSRSSSTR